jgi:hypothetical protein
MVKGATKPQSPRLKLLQKLPKTYCAPPRLRCSRAQNADEKLPCFSPQRARFRASYFSPGEVVMYSMYTPVFRPSRLVLPALVTVFTSF